ncbi:MAG TPA: family 10 glycosylhydrolase [Candidatus Dormibacteraeota bacterium]|nr:family 10 glycosylhydrolase [Candidatus Dormibacteraeota bacterium]
MAHFTSVAAPPPYVPSAVVPPTLPREFRGIWVASVNNLDWPSRPGLSTAQQQSELITILDQAKAFHLNAVLLQVRPACDALYPSSLEPWSEYLTGAMGRAPSPAYDPLALAVREAHRRGLELHAWFNPYRARHHQALSPIIPQHISRTHPNLVRPYGKSLWLDPGEREVQEYSLSVVLDVVRRYDIDGVHFDDYFYPYPRRITVGRCCPFRTATPGNVIRTAADD